MTAKPEDNYLKKELYQLIKSDESIFDFIQESSLDGLWYWDLENPENEWMNPKFWTVLGYRPEDMPHKSSAWQKIINPDDLKEAMVRVKKHFENPEHPYDQIVRYMHKNGSTVWIRCRGMAIRDKNGKPLRMLGAHHDITLLKNDEIELNRSRVNAEESQKALLTKTEEYEAINEELKQTIEELYVAKELAEELSANVSAILEGTADSIWSFDRDYNIIYINSTFQKEFKLAFNVWLDKGCNLLAALPENLRSIWKSRYDRVLSNEQFNLVDEVDTAQGKLFIQVSFNPIVKNNKVIGGSCFGSNITDRRLAEEKLLASKNLLLANLENTPNVAVQWYDELGRVIYWNKASSVLYGFSSDEAIGKTLDLLIHTPEDAADFLRIIGEIKKTGKTFGPYESPVKKADGTKGWVLATTFKIDLSENETGFVCMDVDITDRKLAEEAIQTSEARLRTFVANQPGVAYIVDKNGIFTLSEGQGLAQLGLMPGQVVGMSVFEVYKDVPEIGKHIKLALAGEVQQFQVTVGNLVFDSWIGPVIDDFGNIVAVIGIASDITLRKQAEVMITKLSTSFAHLEGKLFFEAVCNDAAKILGLDYTFVGRLNSDEQSVSVLGGCANGEPMGPLTYNLSGTPCANVMGNQMCCYPSNIQQLFPDDDLLRLMGVESYVGIPLFSKDKRAIGIMVGLHSNILSDSEKIKKVFAIYIDRVSAELQRSISEAALRESESQFRGLFDHAADAIFIADAESGIILNANQRAADLLKSSIDGIIGKHQRELHPTETRNYSENTFQKHKREINEINLSNPVENGVLCSDGTEIPVEILASKVLYKGRECIMGIFRDITERKRAEEALKGRNMFINSLLKAIPVAVFYKDKYGKFLGCNSVFTEVMGVSEEQIIGKSVHDLWPGELAEKYHQMDLELMQNGEHQEYEYKVKDKDGKMLSVIYAKDVFLDSDGKVAGLVGAFLDISERKQVEEELIKAKEKAEESDRLKTAFLQNMSHEIRTPLNAIMGFSGLLPKNFNNIEKLETFSRIIEQRGSDLLDIINDILDISKIESGQSTLNIENCNINELFDELEHFFSNYKIKINKKEIDLQFIKMRDESIVKIKTDKLKLKQILINLIGNALKFTAVGTISCGYKRENNKLQFYVSDTGLGIPKEKHEFIFERFSRIETVISNNLVGGTGLGLPIVKGLVNLLGGRVWLESEYNKGSTFYFTIDYNRADSTAPESQISENITQAFKDKVILIVEDDLYNAQYLKEILKDVVPDIITVSNGLSALKIIKEQRVDLILMDIRLPGIDGYEATRLILLENPGMRIIAQTAYAANTEHQKAIEAGCVDYISKPTKPEKLLKLINLHLK